MRSSHAATMHDFAKYCFWREQKEIFEATMKCFKSGTEDYNYCLRQRDLAQIEMDRCLNTRKLKS